ncbi:MAG: rod shape-determining protein [Proteobacteria bacterium]|nr:rod shape-determining protein [Pseudomonadota bacterium]MCP4918080.1 rod shape-determining protein [Pseudomonadota bacterium]
MPRRLLSGVLGALSQDMAIDLGSATTRVHVRKRGVICRQPSLVALYQEPRGDKRVLAIGDEARAMLGRTPPDVEVVRPVAEGVIRDFEVAEVLLRLVMHECMGPSHVVSPRCVLTIPHGTTEVEKRAVRECAEAAGAREVHLVEEVLAAAIGAGLDVTEPHGNMVVDIGGGTTEVAVVSMGGVVYSRSLKVGGQEMDDAIVRYMQDTRGLHIGPMTAEDLKIQLGSAVPGRLRGEPSSVEVRGRDLVTGFPRAVKVHADEVRSALSGIVHLIVETLLASLDKTPPELAADIVDKGVVMTGGAAQLRGLDRALGEATGLPVIVADDPAAAVVQGAGQALEHVEVLQAVAL